MTPRFNDTSSECAAFGRKLDPYVDGELAPGHAADVGAHALQCVLCQERVALGRAVRRSLQRTARERHGAPASLRAKVVAALAQMRQMRRPAQNGLRGFFSMNAPVSAPTSASTNAPRSAGLSMKTAMVGAALLGALSAAGIARLGNFTVADANLRAVEPTKINAASMTPEVEALLDDLVALHKRPPAPETTNPDDLKRFDLDVGVPVRRPASLPFDAQFNGARLYMSHEGRAALLQYTVKGAHRVSVYVYDSRALPMMSAPSLTRRVVSNRPVYIGRRGGYSIAAAEENGMGIALASDLDDDDASSLALAAIAK